MNFSIASLLLINGFGKAHSFSTNLGNNAQRVCDSLSQGTLSRSCAHTLFIPRRHHENYKSTIHMFGKRGEKDFDTDKNTEGVLLEDQQENRLSSKCTGTNNMFPWERSDPNQISKDMGDLTYMLNEPDTNEESALSTNTLPMGQIVGIGASVAILGILFVLETFDIRVNPSEISDTVQGFFC